jgi:uncharacterized DUF497 family protein
MPHFAFIWTDKNVRHLADNALDPEDAEAAMTEPESRFASESSGRQAVRGYALDGRFIAVIFEQIDELTVFVVTAYEI